MKYVTLEKQDIKLLFKRLFTIHRNEGLFLGIMILVIILANIVTELSGSALDLAESIPQIYFNILGLIGFLIPLIIYKNVTKCDEFDFFKITILLTILMTIISFGMYCYYLLGFADQTIPAFFVTLFANLYYIFIWIILAMGITWLVYHKIDYKELIVVIFGFVVIYIIPDITSIVGQGDTLVYQYTNDFFGIFNATRLTSAIFAGIAIFYGYKYLQEYVIVKHKELIIFATLGISVAVLNSISKIIHLLTRVALTYSDNSWNLNFNNIVLSGLDSIFYYMLVALFVYIYYKHIHKKLSQMLKVKSS
jgi:hypothetical protein